MVSTNHAAPTPGDYASVDGMGSGLFLLRV